MVVLLVGMEDMIIMGTGDSPFFFFFMLVFYGLMFGLFGLALSRYIFP